MVGGWWLFAAGGWRQLAVGGGWWLAVDGPLGRSLTAVLNKKKKSRSQRTALDVASNEGGRGGQTG